MGLPGRVHVGGYSGQLSLGHAAYFGLGAYGLAMFTHWGVPMRISVLLAAKPCR